ncbi:O-antigen ligase family protein [Ferrovibrio terrae]|uniref:O-antigen ligase family protein n=1 Tax=Ferrovibrio terrae TaxID=2594003 RepID=UPI00313830A3
MIRTDIASLELPAKQDWTEVLRRVNQILFALLPLLLLFWRGGADAAASIIGISFLAVAVARRQWGLATHPMLAALLAIWVLLNGLVSPLALDPAASFTRSVAWLRFALLFAATMTWLIQSRRDLRLIVAVWGVTIGFCIVDGLVQLVRGTSLTGHPMYNVFRLTGPLDRPNIGMFVARIGFPLLTAIPLFLPSWQNRTTVAVALLAAVSFVFILLTGERSAALLVIMAMLTVALGSILIFPRYRLLSFSALLTIAGASIAVAVSSERIMERVIRIIEIVEQFSKSHYAELFTIGLDVWRSYPVFGAGMKNFESACWAIAGQYVSDGCPTHPHNVYIEWLAETGIAGLLFYLVFLGLLLLAAWPLLRGTMMARITGLLVAGALLVLLFPLIASQSMFSNWPALVFWSGLSMTMAVVRLTLKETA